VGTFVVHDRQTLYRILFGGDVAVGDAFSRGRITAEGDLVDMLEEVFRGQESARSDWLSRLDAFRQRRPRLNSPAGSRQNIHHHYDISNDFYRLWLDVEMQYTCAYFPDADFTIEQAQQAKMDHVCRKLMLRPGDRVVEAGCGWGSLARHMALRYGARVRAYNISGEQIRFATERAQREGYDDRVEYLEDDYRNIDSEYDVFVSVGMLEHVGRRNYATLGAVVDRCLTDNGRALVHSIGRNRPRLMNAWIEKRIFPGAYPPTLHEMMSIFEPGDFSVLDVENLRLHYAATLEHWLFRFDRAEEQIRTMFDEEFIRAWRLYLAGSIAAFLAGNLQLFQIVFTRGTNNEVPWTREHLYRDARQ
jgi:cyclopropane-fatty-acyl-phospholipid synthase